MDDEQKTAPQNACIFDKGCTVAFAEDADEKDKGNRFSIVAYSGQVITNHWWWGNLAFDLKGIKFAKKRTPVLQEHFSRDRIGFSTKQDISEKVTLDGKFLSNPTAQELRNDMAEGFPMQASVYLPPTLIEHVKEGEKVEVNGHTLKGPGTVFRKGAIQEVSMCTLGADSRTLSKTFAEGGKEKIEFNLIEKEHVMAESKTKVELTAEKFAAEYPDLHGELVKSAKAEGETKQLERFKEIVEVCGDDHELAATLFVEGKDKNEALSAKNKKLTDQLAASQTQTSANETVDPAVQEFSDKQTDGQEQENEADKPASFEAAVEARLKEVNCSKGEAMKFAVNKYPELYKKFRDELEAAAKKD